MQVTLGPLPPTHLEDDSESENGPGDALGDRLRSRLPQHRDSMDVVLGGPAVNPSLVVADLDAIF